MKLVVADSSPLSVFARSKMLAILCQVAGDVIVPQTVYDECTDNRSKRGARMIAEAYQAVLLTLHPDSTKSPPPANLPMLDRGEIAAIALALELGVAVLMDERLGRQAAEVQGVAVIGSAGILLAAKKKKIIGEVRPILQTWQELGYFLSPALITTILQRAGE